MREWLEIGTRFLTSPVPSPSVAENVNRIFIVGSKHTVFRGGIAVTFDDQLDQTGSGSWWEPGIIVTSSIAEFDDDLKLSLKWGDLAKNSLKKLKVVAENSESSATEKKIPRQPANPYP